MRNQLLPLSSSSASAFPAITPMHRGFLQGKTITVITDRRRRPFDDGAGARHMSVSSRPPDHDQQHAGRAACWPPTCYQADKDGTASPSTAACHCTELDGRGVRFDARKFNWLGSTGASNLWR
jgi:hypothetical protein